MEQFSQYCNWKPSGDDLTCIWLKFQSGSSISIYIMQKNALHGSPAAQSGVGVKRCSTNCIQCRFTFIRSGLSLPTIIRKVLKKGYEAS